MPITKTDATSQASATVQTLASETTAQAAAVSTSTAAAASDNLFAQPNPPRFPWLSNIGRMLEAEAQNRFKFPTAPALGDKVDVRA